MIPKKQRFFGNPILKPLSIILMSLVLLPGLAGGDQHESMTSKMEAGKSPKGYVLHVKGKLVYLDLGMRDGVRVGDSFEIIRMEELVHPVTGEHHGGKATIGTVRVTQVFEKLSIAEVLSTLPGAEMAKMDRIRMGNEPMSPSSSEGDMSQMEMDGEHEGDLIHTPDGVLRGLDLSLGGGFVTKEKTRLFGLDLLIPMSQRYAVGGEFGLSKETHAVPGGELSDSDQEIGGKIRTYFGWREKEGMNADGNAGSVVVDLTGGISRLKMTDETFAVVDTNQTPPDTTAAVILTEKKSNNFLKFGFLFPWSEKMTFGLGYDWSKNTGRITGLLRYYTSTIDSDWVGANPDGKIGSLVLTLFGSRDSKAASSKARMGIDIKLPLSQMITFGLTLDTNRTAHQVRAGLNLHVEKKLF